MRRIVSFLLTAVLLLGLCSGLSGSAAAADLRTPIYNGDGHADYLAEAVLSQIDTTTGSDRSRIWAVYRWLLENCTADGTAVAGALDDETVQAFVDNANAELAAGTICLDDSSDTVLRYTASFGADMLRSRVGNSAHFAYALKLLLNHLGYKSEVVWGTFRSADGTTYEHKWNTVELDGITYWLDVRKDYDNYLRTGSPTAQYFMITNETVWTKEHLLPAAQTAAASTTAHDGISVTVDGVAVAFSDAQPFMTDDYRTMLPLAAVVQAMGCTIDWDAVTRSVRITGTGQDLILYLGIGQQIMAVEDTATGDLYGFKSDAAPEIHTSRTYLPIRIVAEVFGYTVCWDKATQTVSLTSGGDPMSLTAAEPLAASDYAAWNALLDAFAG
jgi:hypothetical protein